MKRILVFPILAILLAFAPTVRKQKVWLIGDSTMARKEVRAYPETGWGMPFSIFFDSTIEVDNRALNGRSTRTFITEGKWQPVVADLQEGDYVFVQFGHNDEVNTKKSYTTEEEFTHNLEQYISETRSKKALPVLLTPVARRKFDSTGKIVGTHDVYSELVRKVAAKNQVPLIDLDRKSQNLYQRMGAETSRYLFNYLKKGEHPNYPDGKQDDTHFNELGARMIAELVLEGMREIKLPIVAHTFSPLKK
jgi:lysophospholipase L1-like esterase